MYAFIKCFACLHIFSTYFPEALLCFAGFKSFKNFSFLSCFYTFFSLNAYKNSYYLIAKKFIKLLKVSLAYLIYLVEKSLKTFHKPLL